MLAIDYGADSFKVAYIGPGVPFDVLLNRDSKRKTAGVVTLQGSDRFVGGDAATLVRFHLARKTCRVLNFVRSVCC